MFRIRRDGHFDIICLKDMHPDFVYMVIFVAVITGLLITYAVLV